MLCVVPSVAVPILNHRRAGFRCLLAFSMLLEQYMKWKCLDCNRSRSSEATPIIEIRESMKSTITSVTRIRGRSAVSNFSCATQKCRIWLVSVCTRSQSSRPSLTNADFCSSGTPYSMHVLLPVVGGLCGFILSIPRSMATTPHAT